MNINVEHIEHYSVLNLRGRLDTSNYYYLEEKLNEILSMGKNRIVIDCQKLDYISSSGLRIFLVGLKKVTGMGGEFCVCNLNSNIAEIFEISGFARIFAVFPDVEAAVSSFSK